MLTRLYTAKASKITNDLQTPANLVALALKWKQQQQKSIIRLLIYYQQLQAPNSSQLLYTLSKETPPIICLRHHSKGGTRLKFEPWKVRIHTQNAPQSHSKCFLKDIWILKSSCSLKSPILVTDNENPTRRDVWKLQCNFWWPEVVTGNNSLHSVSAMTCHFTAGMIWANVM